MNKEYRRSDFDPDHYRFPRTSGLRAYHFHNKPSLGEQIERGFVAAFLIALVVVCIVFPLYTRFA